MFQPTVYALWTDFILWNDLGRYPDLPVDLPGPSRREKWQRCQTNEFQIRHLAYSKEAALILHLWILLYDKTTSRNLNLQQIGEQCVLSTPSPNITDCLGFLSQAEFSNRFIRHRHNFLAHLASIQATRQDIVEHDYIYRLVPKTIYLVELLQAELLNQPTYFNNQFTSFSREVARYFSHSKPDELLADLFSKRSLPTPDFNAEADQFLKNLHQREKDARSLTVIGSPACTVHQGANMLVKRIYASWDAKDHNSGEIIKELRALPDKWLKDRKNHWERCTFMPPVVPNYTFDEKKNLTQGTNIASFGVPEYCFDSFQSYIRDVGAILSKYGYFEESDDVSLIDKFFGVAFKDMADWPSDKS